MRLQSACGLLTQLPWTHHLIVMGQAKTAAECVFYLRLAIKERWASRELVRQLRLSLFVRRRRHRRLWCARCCRRPARRPRRRTNTAASTSRYRSGDDRERRDSRGVSLERTQPSVLHCPGAQDVAGARQEVLLRRRVAPGYGGVEGTLAHQRFAPRHGVRWSAPESALDEGCFLPRATVLVRLHC